MYGRLAESLRLLEHGAPAVEARLSRRVRFVPLAVDRVGDVAATMFLRRSVNGVAELDVHSLERVGGEWRLLGGSGGPGRVAVEPRLSLAELSVPAVSAGGGGTARSGPLGWDRSRWVWWIELRAAREVASLVVDDTRRIVVPPHGMALVVWTDRLPAVEAYDAAGLSLGPVPLPDHRWVPESYGDS